MRRWLAAAAAATLALTATGCSRDNDSKGMGDAPVATSSTGKKGGDDTPAIVTNMPDGYGNVSTKCVAGAPPWRLIEGTNTDYNGSQMIVVQDPKKCGGDWVPGPTAVVSTHGAGAEEPDDG
jgi:hypothetical protein